MASFSKRYFEITPINNIDTFTADNGVDIVNFLIPPIPNAVLSTQDLYLVGELRIQGAASAGFPNADNRVLSIDCVDGIHGAISRIDITARQGNTLLEQRNDYGQIAKMLRGNLSNEHLQNGKYVNQQICGENSRQVANHLRIQTGTGKGVPFCVRLQTGFLSGNQEILVPFKMGGVELKIHLTSTKNFLFNMDNGAAAGNLLTSDYSYELKDLKLFGRYNYVAPEVINSLNGVSFKQVANMMSVIQSSADTLSVVPQVSSLDKIMNIYQPNTATKNNFSSNNYEENQLVGLQSYALSNNGMKAPYDFDVVVNPSLGQQVANSFRNKRNTGDAEVVYHNCVASNGLYPCKYSLNTPRNQQNALADNYNLLSTGNASKTNYHPTYVNGVFTSYQYGFAGYATPMTNNLVQLQADSEVKTNNAIVPASIRDQTQTQNGFIVYNSVLNYANLQVSK